VLVHLSGTGSDGEHEDAVVAVGRALAASAPRGHLVLSRFVDPPPSDRGVTTGLATLAASMEVVAARCRGLAGDGITAAPAVMLSEDPQADLRRQVARLAPDWVVSATPLEPVEVDVAIVGDGPAGPDVVRLADGDPAAWELASRLALGWQVPLVIETGGSGRRLADAARRVGVRIGDETATSARRGTVVTLGSAGGTIPDGWTRVVVVPGLDPTRVGFQERADRLVAH
jgi:hypothetical protein